MQMKRRNRQRDRFGPGARVIKVDLLPVKWQSARHLDTARLVPREETCARFFSSPLSLSLSVSLFFIWNFKKVVVVGVGGVGNCYFM